MNAKVWSVPLTCTEISNDGQREEGEHLENEVDWLIDQPFTKELREMEAEKLLRMFYTGLSGPLIS